MKVVPRKVLKKMLASGWITEAEFGHGQITEERVDMYAKGVQLIKGVKTHPRAQLKAYEERELIAKGEELVKVRRNIKKLQYLLKKKDYSGLNNQTSIVPLPPKAKTQREEVIRHLNEEGSITAREAAANYGIMRLSSIIHLLRNEEGMDIETENVVGVNRYKNSVTFAKYVLKLE